MADRFLKKGQSTLEMTIVLMLMVILFWGITQIWDWGNKQIVLRQLRYNESRLAAGTSKDVYIPQWPLIYRPKESDPREQKRPAHLTEDKVLWDAPQLK